MHVKCRLLLICDVWSASTVSFCAACFSGRVGSGFLLLGWCVSGVLYSVDVYEKVVWPTRVRSCCSPPPFTTPPALLPLWHAGTSPKVYTGLFGEGVVCGGGQGEGKEQRDRSSGVAFGAIFRLRLCAFIGGGDEEGRIVHL